MPPSPTPQPGALPSPGRWSSAVCRHKHPDGSSVAVRGASRRGDRGEARGEGTGPSRRAALLGQPSWARPPGGCTPRRKPRREEQLDPAVRGVSAGCSLPAAAFGKAAGETCAFFCALGAGEKLWSSRGHMASNCPTWERQNRVAGRLGCERGAQCLAIASISFPRAFTSMAPLEVLSTGWKISLRDLMEAGRAATRFRYRPSPALPARPGRRGIHSLHRQRHPSAPGPSATGHVWPKATG